MDVEKSIIKKFRRKIWSKFVKVIKEYNLISEGDKIAVCISVGKESILLAKCLEEIKRDGEFKFDLEIDNSKPLNINDILDFIKSKQEHNND